MPGGPTAVWKSLMGEETLGLRSLGGGAVSAMILACGKMCGVLVVVVSAETKREEQEHKRSAVQLTSKQMDELPNARQLVQAPPQQSIEALSHAG